MESGQVDLDLSREGVSGLSSWEIISIYINGGFGDDPGLKAALERELTARKLPLPEPGPARPSAEARQAGAGGTPPPPMSRETFLSYLLLIYTMTGLVYAWLYLPMRLIRGDFRKDAKHRVIQTGISAAYQAVEIATFCFLSEFV